MPTIRSQSRPNHKTYRLERRKGGATRKGALLPGLWGQRWVLRGGGGGLIQTVPEGYRFAGRNAGGGWRRDVYGNATFGSGYLHSGNNSGIWVGGRPFPFILSLQSPYTPALRAAYEFVVGNYRAGDHVVILDTVYYLSITNERPEQRTQRTAILQLTAALDAGSLQKTGRDLAGERIPIKLAQTGSIIIATDPSSADKMYFRSCRPRRSTRVVGI
ncbi:hypothetical protein BDV93DRAFT_607866 [Ceratobasidium sp. AG-I]|nr:hypothetical protein BDV93DRAFT_607866 [Ceratobasidium sp. AG-I]